MVIGQSDPSVVALDDQEIQSLRKRCLGSVLDPSDAGYDTARSVWNGMIDKRPALIVRCRGTADAVAAIAFARERDLEVAVRGGGHNAAGNAVCNGGVVVDLSAMRGIWVDPVARTVRAQGGATWADFDRETALFALGTTGGAISTTGIAGLTLGGGLGNLMRHYGLSCDNLVLAEVVTASGEVLVADETDHADLFWGLRGGGGNFGVVTAFEYRLHPVSTVVGGALVHPIDRARDVLRFYRDFAETAPDELTTFAALNTTPDGVPVVTLLACYSGPIAEGEGVLKPLREYGSPLADTISPIPYVDQQRMLDEGFAPGLQVYWRSDFLKRLDDEVIDVLVEHFADVTSPLSVILLEQMGGAIRRVKPEDTAFAHRDADFNFAIISRWQDAIEAERHVAWTRALHAAVRPYTSGTYVNYLGNEGEDRVKAAYGPEKYAGLATLKKQYDPDNFFHLNQNIRPA